MTSEAAGTQLQGQKRLRLEATLSMSEASDKEEPLSRRQTGLKVKEATAGPRMNPTLTTRTNPLFLPYNQLKHHCSRLHSLTRDSNASLRERVRTEQLLWAEVKLLRNFKDHALLTYLIAYYHSILFQLVAQPAIDDLFQYHVLVRLGDLNRYLQRSELAEYYYSNARNLFPLFGHAYNQLALILADPESMLVNYYKCCYYYVRAAKSSEKSLAIMAESNLRIASRFNKGSVVYQVLNFESTQVNRAGAETDEESHSCFAFDKTAIPKVPTNATDWFYVMVIAIYADNIRPVAKLFIEFMKANFSTQKATLVMDRDAKRTSIYCDRNSYLLLASLDILLDWLKLGTGGSDVLDSISSDLRRMKTCLQSTLASIKFESQSLSDRQSNVSRLPLPPGFLTTNTSKNSSRNTSDSYSTLQDSFGSNANTSAASGSTSNVNQPKLSPALPHDYVLRGFKPLDIVQKGLLFGNSNKITDLINERMFNELNKQDEDKNETTFACFIELDELERMLVRLTNKMEAFGGRLRKRGRNIALESILSNMNNET